MKLEMAVSFIFIFSLLAGCSLKQTKNTQMNLQILSRRIAVLPFESSNPFVSGITMSDYFAVQIHREMNGFQVIERKDMMKILQEQKLNLSGIIRTDRFYKLGTILGVDAVLMGSVHTVETIQCGGGAISVTAKLIEVSSGRILWADVQKVSHSAWSEKEVTVIAEALMEKSAKKMIEEMKEKLSPNAFSAVDFSENPETVQEAKSVNPF